jgi:hypothetical protein
MPSLSSEILSTYDRRINFKGSEVHSKVVRITCAGCLVIIYISMVYYILLFGSKNAEGIQIALCQSFFLWVLFEVISVETLFVLLQHIVIPHSIADDLRQSKDKILSLFANINNDDNDEGPDKKIYTFNLSRFMRSSFRLAEYFPEQKLEKKLVQSYVMPPSGLLTVIFHLMYSPNI